MIAKLNIHTKLRHGITYLDKVFNTPPFKIADIREDKTDSTLHLMLMSSSPGILDGDEYQIKIHVNEACSLKLSTQSYQRLFAMKNSALQYTSVQMGANGSFCYLPHPCVPHQSSSFKSKNQIYLSNNCSLIWGEVLTCGRKLNGEIFLFSRYQNLTEIFLNGRLVVKENLVIDPQKNNLLAMGQYEGYTHQASLIFLDEALDAKDLKQQVAWFLTGQNQIQFGITETQTNGLLVRLLGHKGEQLHQCLIEISNIIQQQKQIACKYIAS